MSTAEAQAKIAKNREEIGKLLISELPLEIKYFNIHRLSNSNKRLIKSMDNPVDTLIEEFKSKSKSLEVTVTALTNILKEVPLKEFNDGTLSKDMVTIGKLQGIALEALKEIGLNLEQ